MYLAVHLGIWVVEKATVLVFKSTFWAVSKAITGARNISVTNDKDQTKELTELKEIVDKQQKEIELLKAKNITTNDINKIEPT